MTPLQLAGYAAQALASVSALVLARRRQEYRPAAVALVLLAVVNLLDAPTAAALAPLPRPIEGGARVLVYLDGAINLANYAVIAGFAVAIAVSQARRRAAVSAVAGVWLVASVVLAAMYPSPLVRGDGLQRVYFATDLIGLFVSTVALITSGRASIAAKKSPNGPYALALSLAALDAAILLAPFSPWRADLFSMPYGGIQVAITILFAVITTAQVTTWFNISKA